MWTVTSGLAGFATRAPDQVLAAIRKLGEGPTLRGVVQDLRGNEEGSGVVVRPSPYSCPGWHSGGNTG